VDSTALHSDHDCNARKVVRAGLQLTTNIPIVVEACADLTSLAWVSLQSGNLGNGSLYFSDPQWMNHPTRFYRLRWP
jgi:hypothetical protein